MEELQIFIEQRYKLLEEIMLASHLSWIFFVLVLFVLYKTKKRTCRAVAGALLIGTLFFMYARYVERYWIDVNYLTLDRDWNARVVLIADQHLGVYKNGDYMQRVVEKINALESVDYRSDSRRLYILAQGLRCGTRSTSRSASACLRSTRES